MKGPNRKRMWISGCHGLGRGDRGLGEWGVTVSGYGISFGGDENVLKLDYGDSFTTLQIHHLITL